MKLISLLASQPAIRFALLSVFVVVVAVIAPLSARGQYLHPKISGKQLVIRNVVILPAKVNVVRTSLKGPEGMAAESEELSGRVEKTFSEVLSTQKSITTLSGPARSSEGVGTQARYSVADIQAKFEELLPKVVKKPGDVTKGRFTMGDEVLNLNLDRSADAIVFVRGKGQKITPGKATFNILVGGTPAYLSLQFVVIDARTGDVLLYTEQIFAGDPTTADDRIRRSVERGLKKLPSP
jgi:hypothetical protein